MSDTTTLILFIVVGIPLFIILFAIIYFCIKDSIETEVKNQATVSTMETEKSEISKKKEENINILKNDRQILEKLPHISNLASWYNHNSYIDVLFDRLKLSQEFSAIEVKYLLRILLKESLNTSYLVAISSELGYLYESWCGLLGFLAEKGFIIIKEYKFPAVYDGFGLLLKSTSNYLVINITDIGKAYAKEEQEEK